jgi:hypothetical protein
MTLKFSLYRFSKNLQISNFMKIRPVEGVESSHADKEMDRHIGLTKTIAAFHTFAKAPKTTQAALQRTEKVT